MPFVEISQVLVVVCFLALLITLQHLIRRNRDGLRNRLTTQKRLQLLEVLALGTGERLSLVALDGRECLVHSARHGSSLIVFDVSVEDQK